MDRRFLVVATNNNSAVAVERGVFRGPSAHEAKLAMRAQLRERGLDHYSLHCVVELGPERQEAPARYWGD